MSTSALNIKRFALPLMFASLLHGNAFAEPKTSEDAKNGDLTCYMPYSVRHDHMVMGCEIQGYHMRYDLAQQWHIFMVLLPNGVNSIEKAGTYFSIDTFDLNGGSMKQLFEADIKGIQAKRPGTKLVKQLAHKLPLGERGECVGAEIEYSKKLTAFPNEIYFMCDGGSGKYAIMLSLGARTQKQLVEAEPLFLKWMDVPQVIRDMKITTVP